jgi:structural maintenance of chromosome 2
MHIVEVVLDGFKSYSNRVVVGPFDEGFNAICGMNGTGKSNILDAICFVLGISNLTQVWHPPFTASARAIHARTPECT